jgi:transketolase
MSGIVLAEDRTSPEPIRVGFGRGLAAAGDLDERVLALCADLTESTQMHLFRQRHAERFIQVGVAEQNLVTVAAGLAHAGFIPFTSSYAAFSPGRNWEQIKTTVCLNDQPVKVVGSHAGLNVGPDGATHQMLEDIALMRVLPNMVVVAPADSLEAEAATIALARDPRPAYLRLARDAMDPVFSSYGHFVIGRALTLRTGADVGVIATGTMTRQALDAADILAASGIEAAVLHVPTVKPLDKDAVLNLAESTDLIVTIEEGQRAGGLGGAVVELLGESRPTRVIRLGVEDRYGESGPPKELLRRFGLDASTLAERIREACRASSLRAD